VIFLICAFLIIVPNLAYAIVRSVWCTKHWKRQEYISIVSHDGREYRWCSECKNESPWADKAWRKL
jgi:hypothetical protein